MQVLPEDTWAFMYTSGTTGRPKGAIRTHADSALLSLVTAVEHGIRPQRHGAAGHAHVSCQLPVLRHGVRVLRRQHVIYDRKSFDPEHLLGTLSAEKVTFTSLVPTHYIMMLGLPDTVKAKYDVDRVSKLLMSSAPARRDTKLAIMEYFRNSRLFEMYGSTEAGLGDAVCAPTSSSPSSARSAAR